MSLKRLHRFSLDSKRCFISSVKYKVSYVLTFISKAYFYKSPNYKQLLYDLRLNSPSLRSVPLCLANSFQLSLRSYVNRMYIHFSAKMFLGIWILFSLQFINKVDGQGFKNRIISDSVLSIL